MGSDIEASQRDAIIYVRISRDREGAGLGIERQREDCEALARRLGWRVVDVYADNDISAYSGKPRPAYRKLLDDLRSGRATAVLVWHTDRLHRSPVELEEYISVCEPTGVITHTVKAGPLDLSTPSGRMIARQLGAVARFESEHKSDRQRRKRQQMAEAGQWKGGRRPFGYEADGITVRQVEADALVHVVDDLLSGVSLSACVRWLNERGILTSTGNTWTPSELAPVLKRARNAGIMVHQGEEMGRAQWPAIMEEEKWRAVVALLADPQRRTTPGPERRWLGSGLYECGLCVEAEAESARIICTTAGGRKGVPNRPTYRCADGRNHVARDANHVDRFVGELVIERLSRDDARNMIEGRREDDQAARQRTLEREAIRLREQEAAEMFAAGELTRAQLATMNKRFTDRREELARADAEMARTTALTPFRDGDPREVWEGLDLDRKRAVVQELMRVIILPMKQTGRPQGWTVEYGKVWGYFDPRYVRIEWKTPGQTAR
ncbi:recombinase family protein [Nonomuraea bangladeshensis]|uniref:Recombinase family protein n=1 Tax=Nonomuraea bangladeshensis TaxID=404385 RepID=A0ABV3H1P5_9ACTN